jgi:2-polyprenyl-6-methoxyphenol hydroxylase-like FAD-dependent oxidoreductase
MSTQTRDRAVVLGGSIAGLLAARALADHYASVVIVERDPLPSAHAHRRGVPQGHHVHGILPLGRQILEDLFPGYTAELTAEGALQGDILGNVRWILNGRMLRQAETGLVALSASRPLIEGAIRDRVLALPNVTVLDGHDIVGLRATKDLDRIISVLVTSQYGDASQILSADLVVDATGRGSRTPRWLAELGYVAPQEDRVMIDLGYATRVFDCPPGAFGDDIVVTVARFPGQTRGGVMQRLEGGRALVTLIGVLGERPPASLQDFIEYAKSLAAPDIFDFVRDAAPAGDPTTFRIPTYVRRRYEQLTEFPAGLLVIGDAVCAFNPVYAQGMSVAAASAAALRDELRLSGDPDALRYFSTVSRLLDAPWGIAVGGDMALAGVQGPALPKSPLTPQYMAKLQQAAAEDAEVAAALVRVNSLIDPPPTLLRPELVARVEEIGVAPAR